MYPLYMGEALINQGFSLIPVRGDKDSSQPKAAAIAWASSQQRRATLGDVAAWTQLQGWQLAIVTGRISGMVAVDFDDLELWQRFSTEKAHLLKNKIIVRTRRGVHLYIPVAGSGAPIASKNGNGWDFQADGKYVVAPGAIINDHTYTIISDVSRMPAPQPGQLQEILSWLQPDGASAPTPEAAADRPAQLTLPVVGPDRHALIAALKQRFSAWSLTGRNNALFRALAWGRDRGLSAGDCMALLADFITAPGTSTESQSSRMREFNATLRSVFSRPARPVGTAPARLPDAARQALSRLGLMHVWRLIDSLFAVGYRPGQTITRKIAIALCGDQLGQRNIWQALADERFFARTSGKVPSAPPSNAYGVEPQRDTTEIEKCKYSRGKILQLIHESLNPSSKGRPQNVYKIPSAESICRLLEVEKPRWSTPIDHASSKEARKHLYHAKISQKPGTYANAALATWFGVCPKTIKTYEKELKIVRRTQYEEAPIASWNVGDLPEPRMGHWLQADGKRYPTVQALAENLLKRTRVSLVKQLPNYICTAEHLQQQKQAAIVRMNATGTNARALPTAAPKAAEIASTAVVRDSYANKVLERSLKQSPVVVQPKLDSLELENGYPDDSIRALKRGWKNTAGSDWTVKSDRLELVQAVLPTAADLMKDHQYGYLMDATPRRVLMWLRKRMGDPAYTRADVAKLHQLMDQQLTRKKAVQMLSEFGRAKVLRAAEFISKRTDIQSKPAYLITCLRADQRMAALLGGGRHGS